MYEGVIYFDDHKQIIEFMKYMYFTQYLKFAWILFFLLENTDAIHAQDTSITDKKFYYRFTIGAGFGGGYPVEDNTVAGYPNQGNGVGSTVEFAVQKNTSVLAVGATGVEEFLLLSNSKCNQLNYQYRFYLWKGF